MALYYANGGPGPASKLWRVNVEGTGSDSHEWHAASAEQWGDENGWQPRPGAQLDILWLGEFSMIDESDVPKVQNEIRAANERAEREAATIP
jgi:hypothetical protein